MLYVIQKINEEKITHKHTNPHAGPHCYKHDLTIWNRIISDIRCNMEQMVKEEASETKKNEKSIDR